MKKIFTLLGISVLALISAQNLISNPGFENWTTGTPDGYLVSGITVLQGTGSNVHSGNYSLGITAPANGNKTVNPSPDITVDVSKNYVFSGWYLDNTPNAKFKYWNQFRAAGDLGVNALQAASFSVDSSQWVFFTAEAVPPAAALVARPGLRVFPEVGSAGVIYFDDVVFQDKATLAVSDVSAFDKQIKMNTTVGNSLTIILPVKATVNLLTVEGKLISSNRLNSGESIDTSSLAKGMYIVTVDDGTSKVSRKVIKH